MSKDNGNGMLFLAGVGLGALLGAAVALLTAPQSGKETREDLMAFADQSKDKAQELAAIAAEKAQEYAAVAQEYAAIAQEKSMEAMQSGKEMIANAKARLDAAASTDDGETAEPISAVNEEMEDEEEA